jgi:protein-L-isoaspartate(D-aspartate) O-methyltransferase
MIQFMSDYSQLIKSIQERSPHYLNSKEVSGRILEAMRQCDRMNFLPVDSAGSAYEDIPLPIGEGQTCSQPSMVAFMLDQLEIEPGHRLMEIGAGSGWASAIASRLAESVIAIEINPALFENLQMRLKAYPNVIPLLTDGSAGYPDQAPYDRIFLSAGVDSTHFNPEILLNQLTPEGILLYPEQHGSLFKLIKSREGLRREAFYGVSFVPLKGCNF